MPPSPWVRAKPEHASVSRVAMLKFATYLLVAASFGVVFVSAVPAIARELGYVEARVVSRSSARSSSAKRAGLEATKAAERRIEMREEAFGLPHPKVGTDPTQRTKIAVARKDLALHAEADASSPPIGRIPRNQVLIVMKEEGGWLLVLNQDDDNAELGWVREADVLQR